MTIFKAGFNILQVLNIFQIGEEKLNQILRKQWTPNSIQYLFLIQGIEFSILGRCNVGGWGFFVFVFLFFVGFFRYWDLWSYFRS